MYTTKQLYNFFTVSNAIENIHDLMDTKKQLDFALNILPIFKYLDPEEMMFLYHSKLSNLNGYCKAGVLRDYDVYVGGRKCMAPELIRWELNLLFADEPKTYIEIKQWHVRFEKCHPFGDWNWRTGRILMLRQLMHNRLPIPTVFRSMANFDANRQRYYRWFS